MEGLWQGACGAWHSVVLELDAGLGRISCWITISTWIFLVKVLRIVPEGLVKWTRSVAVIVGISSREWGYPTAPTQEVCNHLGTATHGFLAMLSPTGDIFYPFMFSFLEQM